MDGDTEEMSANGMPMSRKNRKSRPSASNPLQPLATNGPARLNSDPDQSVAKQEASAVGSALTEGVYLSFRESLNSLEQKTTEQLDKTIVQLAMAALGVTVIFRGNLAPDPAWWTIPILFLSWTALVGSIISVVVSHRASQEAIRYQRDLLDTEMETQKVPNQTNPSAEKTERWNRRALSLFVAGVILLLVFSGANLVVDTIRSRPDDLDILGLGD